MGWGDSPFRVGSIFPNRKNITVKELGVGQSNDRQSTDAMIIREETREAQQQLHLTEPSNSVTGEGQTGNMSRPVDPVPDVLNLTGMENHRVRSDEPCLSSDMTASNSNTSTQNQQL